MDHTMVTFNKAKRVQSMRKRKAAARHHHNGFLQNLVMNSLMIVGCTLLLYSPTKQLLSLHLPNMLSCLSSPKCVFVLVNVIVVFLLGESRINGHNGSQKSSPASDVYDEYVRRARAQRKLVRSSPTISTREKPMQLAYEMERKIVIADKATSSFDDEVVASQVEREIVVVDDEITPVDENEMVESPIGSEIVTTEEIRPSDQGETNEEEEEAVNETLNDGEKAEEQVEGKIEETEEKEGGGGGGDDLNRRIDNFIARINRQRQLEIQSLVSCEA